MIELASAEPTGGIAGWAVEVMETLGAPGAAIAVAAENLFPPIPSEVILPLAGFTASRGSMSLVAAIAWTTVGSVVGAIILYYLGALIGRRRIIAVAARLPLVKVADVERTEAWFQRHGTKTVFFGRMIPIFRSLISIPAGVERMSLPVFVLLTAAGSLIWNTVLVLAGYQLGQSWTTVETYVGMFQKGVIVVVVLAVTAFVVLRLRSRRRDGAHRAPDDLDNGAPVDGVADGADGGPVAEKPGGGAHSAEVPAEETSADPDPAGRGPAHRRQPE